MSYEERQTYSIHDVYFDGTLAEIREIRARSVASKEWLAWHALNQHVTNSIFKANDPAAVHLCERHALAERAMVQLIVKLVHECCAPSGD